MQFQPGNLVRARDRVWVVQSDSTDDWLLLRPLGGADDEITRLMPDLEPEKVTLAQFDSPDTSKVGSFNSSRLLYDALRFQLRSSSGPFRCFGSINFEPRSYQFVPLLMAMRQKVVRLLIADDVGVGKTIESGLIVRELIDRGQVQRFAVLCPPHLVEQWCDELEHHFNLTATALTASSSQRLERLVPHGHTLTEYCPYLVVSLDYIKNDRHRDYFENMPLDLLLVDEVHTCVRSAGTNKQKRFDLLQKVTKDPNRHLLLLTATPHSGNEDAFFNLLSLLDEKFIQLKDEHSSNSKLRQDLSNYFVQRRRQDIKEWKVDANERLTGFPVRKIADLSYDLDPSWQEFFEQVQDYCAKFILRCETQGDINIHSAAIYEIIALFRCTASSPAAALQTLENRFAKIQDKLAQVQYPSAMDSDTPEADSALYTALGKAQALNKAKSSAKSLAPLSAVQDMMMLDALEEDFTYSAASMLDQELNGDESTELSDQEPSLLLDNSKELNKLIKLGQKLQGIDHDPKLKRVVSLVYELLQAGFQPVIFCRFVSTAHYVADCLKDYLIPALGGSSKPKTKGTKTTKAKGKTKAKAQANAPTPANDTTVAVQAGNSVQAGLVNDDAVELNAETLHIGCVTGELVPEDRKAQVEELMLYPYRVLVATDCLSEGINLQQGFTAVIHYDLAWNPTRHEQREGRVDRFGQTAPEVRCAMVYCKDNPIDQLVLNVIQKKNKNIQRALGITVPVPQQAEFIEKSIILNMLTQRTQGHQSSFLSELERQGVLQDAGKMGQFDEIPAPDHYIEELNLNWEDALKKANRQITIFAQTKIHPEDIAPIWHEQQRQLGSFSDVLEFSKQSCAIFGCKLEPMPSCAALNKLTPAQLQAQAQAQAKLPKLSPSGITWNLDESVIPGTPSLRATTSAPTQSATNPSATRAGLTTEAQDNLKFYFTLDNINNLSLKQNFKDEGFTNREVIDFAQLYRASPFVSILASSVVEQAMSGKNLALNRCGISLSKDVTKITSIYLLRLRYQMKLTYNQQTRRHLMVEEIVPFMAQGVKNVTWDSSERVQDLLVNTQGQGNFQPSTAKRHLDTALALIKEHPEQLQELAVQRAAKLQQDHASVKQFSSDGHVTQVQPCMPVDIMGIYVLLPIID